MLKCNVCIEQRHPAACEQRVVGLYIVIQTAVFASKGLATRDWLAPSLLNNDTAWVDILNNDVVFHVNTLCGRLSRAVK